jgi:hypothetical protein
MCLFKAPAKPPTLESYPAHIRSAELTKRIADINAKWPCTLPNHVTCYMGQQVDPDDPEAKHMQLVHVQMKGGKTAIWAQGSVSATRYLAVTTLTYIHVSLIATQKAMAWSQFTSRRPLSSQRHQLLAVLAEPVTLLRTRFSRLLRLLSEASRTQSSPLRCLSPRKRKLKHKLYQLHQLPPLLPQLPLRPLFPQPVTTPKALCTSCLTSFSPRLPRRRRSLLPPLTSTSRQLAGAVRSMALVSSSDSMTTRLESSALAPSLWIDSWT